VEESKAWYGFRPEGVWSKNLALLLAIYRRLNPARKNPAIDYTIYLDIYNNDAFKININVEKQPTVNIQIKKVDVNLQFVYIFTYT
jgi:hypothetical protein